MRYMTNYSVKEICILQVQSIPMDPLDLIVGRFFVNLMEMLCKI